MKILFMGTPELSRTVLRALCEAGHEIVLCVTQPDREKGRGKAVQCSPVKEEALLRGIPCFQPERLRREENVARLRALLEEDPADVGVVAAFGQILPQSVLDMPRLGCLNVHTSLLPKYRGASPIEAAILAGERETGVTTMQMDAGLDTGDILLQRTVPIGPRETGGSLTETLAAVGGELITETLSRLEAGTLAHIPQTGESSYAGLIRKEDGHLDLSQPAERLERRIRAFDPWPGTYLMRGGKRLKILQAVLAPEPETISGPAGEAGGEAALPGTVTAVSASGIDLMTGRGILRVTAVQPEGKKAMPADAFLRGYPVRVGEIWGETHE